MFPADGSDLASSSEQRQHHPDKTTGVGDTSVFFRRQVAALPPALNHDHYKRGKEGLPIASEAPLHRDNGLHDHSKRGNAGFAIASKAYKRRGNDGLHDHYKRGNTGFAIAPEAYKRGNDGLHDYYKKGKNGFALAPDAPWHRDNGLHDHYKRGSDGYAIAPEAWLGDDGFAKATEALDIGEKVRVRDIWTPVSAASPPLRGLEVSEPPHQSVTFCFQPNSRLPFFVGSRLSEKTSDQPLFYRF